ncbi:hypothetical protein M406DRAFT_90197 [Cryphonectria parasitica EP155]|uniref:DUF221-domain-containing protein n=1 Tax=Cryphonectria parasitica (strain ATCC 38755 / EP155) TaxID=660469 RepID=A0A9P5CS07_CRYP1|nr:uncharacterized protein M406DRAFT_90197 [Cryphonectria parasitica EP155]KAF3767660.1 hypothetical protein M406DRAFT_90197 [Cryphonectria parasitica EP155]
MSNSTDTGAGSAQAYSGYGLESFLASLAVSVAVAGVQLGLFILLRNKLARIYKPKTFLVPERERTDPPPSSPWALITGLMKVPDREIIKKCGLDAYFFLRYLKTLLVIFVPLTCIILPILLPVNFVDGRGSNLWTNTTTSDDSVVGLSVLAWGNVKTENYERYWAHLILALAVIIWVCYVVFAEMRVFVRVRQDWLTSAEHRLRASANTVLVSSIPKKWLSEEALRGLFDVFPGGIKNIWLTQDFTPLLDKIKKRNKIHKQLESAESDLIRDCKKRQLEQREKDEKEARKQQRTKKPTKKERVQRQKDEDQEARRRAQVEDGLTMGENGEDVAEAQAAENAIAHPEEQTHGGQLNPLNAVGKVFKTGANVVERAGLGVRGGLSTVSQGIDSQLERSGGFVATTGRPSMRPSEYNTSKSSDQQELTTNHHINTTRNIENIDDMYVKESTRWYQFWKPPSGGYTSPVPQGARYEKDPFDLEKSLWTKIKHYIPFMGDDEVPVEYPQYVNPGQTEVYQEQPTPEWEKWIKAKDRPHHRLPFFDFTPSWLPGLPFIHKKVDTIYWCRQELARLNVEIEEDQKNPERFPKMTSAFIQFNNQSAAHMACQSLIHHVPKHMAPRVVEISPEDVIWDNMAMSWWMQWSRVILACGFVFGMVILWGFPVAFSASLSEIDSLIQKYSWLGFLKENASVYKFVKLAAAVLPQAFLALILALVPIVLSMIAEFQGVKTGASRSEWVQIYYFFFLFVEVFLVVSITSGALQTIANIAQDIEGLPTLLAENLPDASNYFFSYLLLQGASVSSGTLLQVSSLAMWYVLSRILDSTARAKFIRQTSLPKVKWGSFFPVYTNFACIALVFSVIAPIMSIFAVINFSLLWCAHRYNMLYVTRFKTDTGGKLYPRALNQMFTGLYVMELCLIGLFFLVQADDGTYLCYKQGIIMIVAIILTALYQIMLNREFGPLLSYLPITFEDEAVLRDVAFEVERQIKENKLRDDDEESSAGEKIEANASRPHSATSNDDGQYELDDLDKQEKQSSAKKHHKKSSSGGMSIIKHSRTWVAGTGNAVLDSTYGSAERKVKQMAQKRHKKFVRDLENQRAIGDALFGDYADEIEDLNPADRDEKIRKAFTHSALRARRPVVWIPRDDIGVSDDEVRRTNDYSNHIRISNEGTALDSKVRVLYGQAPPDFSEEDLIQL